MATKTFGEMFDKIVKQSGLKGQNIFADSKTETLNIKEDINDKQKEILNISGSYLRKSQVTIVGGTVADQRNYDIPGTIQKVSFVEIIGGGTKYYPDEVGIGIINNLSNIPNDSSDTPIYYSVDQNQIVLYPTPATSSNTINVNGLIYATDLDISAGNTDENTNLEIKEGFENVIFWYCMMELYLRRENFASSDRYEAKYEKLLKEYKGNVGNQTNNILASRQEKNIINPNYNNKIN